ncbi:MAG TPA: enoyl-CoA hydratase-related protein [Acidimicrobiia bacterium]
MPDELPSHHRDIHLRRDGQVATVTIDRPKSKNACTGDMWVAIGAAFRELSWSGARVIVLTGANENFCSGADLTPTKHSDPPSASSAPDASPGPTGTMTDAMRVLADVVLAIHACPVPVVAKVDGLCVGAGLGLALAADLTWCSDRSRFSAIFAKRGLSLDFGTSWLLRQRVGVHIAKELAFTAKIVSGPEAFALGLVNAVVPAAELDDAVSAVAETIAAGPPIAIAAMKRELDNASSSSLAHALEVEALAQSVNANTDDLREALTAFVERRPPNFTGR